MNKYLMQLLLLLAGMGFVIVAANFVIDPANIYRVVDIPGFNALKPRLSNYGLLWKLHYLEQETPAVVLLGNSRVEVGINPVSEAANNLFGSTTRFNGAIAASTMYGTLRVLQHLLATRSPEKLYIGIDFAQFPQYSVAAEEQTYVPFEPMFAVTGDNTTQPWHAWQLHTYLLFSLDVLDDAIKTIKQQDKPLVEMTAAGQINNDFLRNKLSEDHAFRPTFLLETRRWAGINIAAPDDIRRIATAMTYFRKIIRLAKQHKTELVFFINPAHVFLNYVERIHDNGVRLNHWRWALVETIATEEQELCSTQAITLWDFSITNDITGERLPPAGSDDFMQWYIDPSHYNDRVGDLVLQVLLTGQPVQTPRGEQFGYKLDKSNVDAINALHEKKIKQWQQQNPDDNRLLQEIISTTRASLGMQ